MTLRKTGVMYRDASPCSNRKKLGQYRLHQILVVPLLNLFRHVLKVRVAHFDVDDLKRILLLIQSPRKPWLPKPNSICRPRRIRQ